MGAGASANAAEAVKSTTPAEMQAAFEALPAEQRARLQAAMVAQAGGAAPTTAGGAAEASSAEAVAEATSAEAAAAPEQAAEAAAAPEAVAPAEAAGPAATQEGAKAADEVAAPAKASAEAAQPETTPEVAQPEATASAEAAAPAEASAAAEAAAPAEGAASAEASAQGAAPEEDRPLAETAPFLAEYFRKAQERTEALIADHEKLMALALDPEAQKKLKEESKAWYHAEAKPLLEKSFKEHDPDNSNTLDPEEAAKFFKTMIEMETRLAKTMSALSIESGIKMSVAMLQNMLSAEEREEVRPQIEEQIKTAVEAAKNEVQKKEDTYLASKEAHDAAAFKVLDVDGDGTIQLCEFIAAFEPETERNTQLHLALGYLTQEEIDNQKKLEAEAREKAGGASECNQQ